VAGNFNIDTAVVTETPDAALPKDTGGDHDTVVRWPRIISQPVGWTRKKNAYAGYQTRTTRELPVIVVEPC